MTVKYRSAHEKLKQEARKRIIAGIEDPSKNLDLIDRIQRLGVCYPFEEEIKELLEKMHRNFDAFIKDNVDDLHQISLCFRLLRQQGYKVSCEMFSSFKDDEGKFKESLTEDGEGLLSLYEATHLRIHGEDILENAFSFSVAQLKSIAMNNASMLLTRQINHALRFPIQRTIPRLVARFYISMYQKKPSHNPSVLKFSKLDFNILQKQYQKELRQISRAIVSKAMAMASIQDDIYNAYGTPEELKLLTEAIQRWDPDMANQLPGYIKNFFRVLLDVYNEIGDAIAAEGKLYKVQYAKEEVKRLAKAYMREVKWYQQNYTPTMEEYMEVGLVTSGSPIVSTLAFVGVLGEIVTKTSFEWLANFPKIVVATSTLGRLYDDLADVHEIQQARGHAPSAVKCYMKQYGVTEHEAVEELSELMEGAWKEINEECLGLPKAIPFSTLNVMDTLIPMLLKIL
nr:terpene synthase 20 [Aquilaria agallochum]